MKSFAKGILGLFLVFAIVAVTSLYAPQIHTLYLNHVAGKQIVQVVRMDKNGVAGGGTGAYTQLPSGKIGILTNYHVCVSTKMEYEGNLYTYIIDSAGTSLVRRILKIGDSQTDLCLIDSHNYDGASLSMGSDPFQAQESYILGHPKLNPLTVSIGHFIADKDIELITKMDVKDPSDCKGRLVELPIFFQMIYGVKNVCFEKIQTKMFSNPIKPGNSGSPIVNFYGNIIGVIFAGSPENEHEAYAVPLSKVVDFIKGF